MGFFRTASILGLTVLTTAVYAQSNDQYMEQATLAMQNWGQQLNAQVSARLDEQIATDIKIDYGYQLAQHEIETTDRIALATGIDLEPSIIPSTEEMLAQNVSTEGTVDCNN